MKPIGGIAGQNEIAGSVLRLASDAAWFVLSAALQVDAGLTVA